VPIVYTGIVRDVERCYTGYMDISKYDTARFWSRVGVGSEDSCWYWDNPTHSFGYGWFKIDGKNQLAHRVAKIMWGGEEDGHVLHGCNNPSCCNPKHLRWGTPKDNHLDSVKAGTHVSPPKNNINPPIRYGEDNVSSKMTENKVVALRKGRASGMSYKRLSEKYGISLSTVAQIVNYRTWRSAGKGEL
jgi:hypothetical protein